MKEIGFTFLLGLLYVILTGYIEIRKEAKARASQKKLNYYKTYPLLGSRWK